MIQILLDSNLLKKYLRSYNILKIICLNYLQINLNSIVMMDYVSPIDILFQNEELSKLEKK